MNINEMVMQELQELEILGTPCKPEHIEYARHNAESIQTLYDNGMSVSDICDYIVMGNLIGGETPVEVNHEVIVAMPFTLQQTIAQVCHDMPDAARFMEDGYSGRGMMGRKCLAIAGTSAACKATLAQIMYVLADDFSNEMHEANDFASIAESKGGIGAIQQRLSNTFQSLCNFNTDGWGRDGMVMYWQELEFEDKS